MRAARFSALSEAVVARRAAETRQQLRATRPGRQSRRIFALALERAVDEAMGIVRAAMSVAKRRALVERPGVPNVAVQARLNAVLAGKS